MTNEPRSVGRPRKGPPTDVIAALIESGMTHQQIADYWFVRKGVSVARSTISAAWHRSGNSESNPRYRDEIPWHVNVQHLTEYPVRMLRLLGRLRSDRPLTPQDRQRLLNWLALLEAENAVVGYDPDGSPGFHYVERRAGEGSNGIPIRVKPIVTTLPESGLELHDPATFDDIETWVEIHYD